MEELQNTQESLDVIMHSDSEKEEQEGASELEDEDANSDDDVDYHPKSESSSDSSDDSERETGGDTEEAAAGWRSKNGHIEWSPTTTETLPDIPAATGLTPGPTSYATSQIDTLRSTFDLFLTDEIIQHIVNMTNRHGRRSYTAWKDVDATELQAFIGLLLLAGVYRSRKESTDSLWDDQTGRTIFRATMSGKRFVELNAALRFDDKRTRPARCRNDKLAAIRTIWDKWNPRLARLFNPNRDICVGEQLVQFKGRCSFRQYMPRKPAKYGIKVWVTCDVGTSYAWRMQVYTGKAADGRAEVNQGMMVVLEMTEGLKGNTVTCDNFFTTYALAEELLKRKMTLVGTIRRNRPELPPRLLRIKEREVRSSLFAFTKTHTAVSYVPRRGRNVTLLSTKHREPAVSDGEKRKPVIICDYNRCKGGVDNLDKVRAITHQ